MNRFLSNILLRLVCLAFAPASIVGLLSTTTFVISAPTAVRSVETIAELRALDVTNVLTGTTIIVKGYYDRLDGAGGQFCYDFGSTATDNGGTVIAPTAGAGRWLRASTGQQISVLEFGAKGDDSTTNTTAIQAEIDFLAATGGTIVVPKGVYRVGELTLPGSNITFIGEGKGVSILKWATLGSNNTGIAITGSNIQFHDIGLTGPGVATSFTLGERLVSAIGTDTSTRLSGLKFQNCHFTKSGSNGLYCQFVDNIQIIDCTADEIAYAGLMFLSCNNGRVRGGIIDMLTAVGSSSNAYGISLTHNSSGTTFAITATEADDLIHAVAHGLTAGDNLVFSSLTGGTGLTAGSTVYHVIADGLTDDVFKVSATAGGAAVNITTDATAGVVAAFTGTGVPTDDEPFCNDWAMSGVTVFGPKIWQALDTHGAFNVTVEACKTFAAKRGITLSTSSGAAANYAGYSNRAVNNVIDINNQDGSSASVTGGTAIAIQGASGSAHEGCIVSGNIIKGYGASTTTPIRVGVYARGFVITGNVFEAWDGYGIYAEANSVGGVIANNVFRECLTDESARCIFLFGAGIDSIVVSGNTHHPITNNALYGLITDSTVPVGAVTASGNDLSACTNPYSVGLANDITSGSFLNVYGPGVAAKITDSEATGQPKLSFYQQGSERSSLQYLHNDSLTISSVLGLKFKAGSTQALAFDSSLTATFAGAIVGSTQALSGAGAINVTTLTTKLTTTGADALTLANGVDGQVKIITMIATGGNGTLDATTSTGWSTITFDAIGDSVTLQFYTTLGWMVVGNYNATVTP